MGGGAGEGRATKRGMGWGVGKVGGRVGRGRGGARG